MKSAISYSVAGIWLMLVLGLTTVHFKTINASAQTSGASAATSDAGFLNSARRAAVSPSHRQEPSAIGTRSGSAPLSFGLLLPPGFNLQAGQDDKPVEQVFQNIQVLKGLPSSQIYAVMNYMRASLGAKCDTCHVKEADGWKWAKDDKAEKRTARQMIQMTLDLNRSSFGGRNEVTCYTCHRGQSHPLSIPAIEVKSEPQRTGAVAPDAKPSNALPSVEQVLGKYVQALGGQTALDKLKTRSMKGTITAHLLPTSPIEIHQSYPNKYLLLINTPKGLSSRGFNGTVGWSSNGQTVTEIRGAPLDQLRREANFTRDFKLRELYREMKVTGTEKVGEHQTYLVRATTPENKIERLYFDTQTGLLVRRVTFIETMIGPIPEATDYEDYREVDGVQMPFTKHRQQLEGFEEMTLKLTEIRNNVPADDSRYNMPAAQK